MYTTGQVAEASVNLRDGPGGNILDVLVLSTPILVLNDYGDGWPLVLAGSGDGTEVGFIDAHFVAWDDVPQGGAAARANGAPPQSTRVGNDIQTALSSYPL